MAEGYIGETTCSTYIRQRLHWITSATSGGHNVSVELQMRRTNAYGGSTFQYPSNSYITINGNRQEWGWTANSFPQIPPNNTNWITFASRTLFVGHTAAATIGISGGNYNMGGYLNGDTGGSISLEALYTNPSTPSVTIKSKTHNSATFGVSIGSYGNPSGVSGRYIEAALLQQNTYDGSASNGRRYASARNVTSATITVNNSSSANGGSSGSGFTITGNTRYYYGGYATNTQLSSQRVTGQIYLPCPPFSALSLSSQEYASYNTVKAVISYTRQSDGGAETRSGYYRYSTNGGASYGSWTFFGTVSNTSGTFTATLPTTSSSVILQAKLTTPNGGDSEAKSLTIATKTTHVAPDFSYFYYYDSSKTADITGDRSLFVQYQSRPTVMINTNHLPVAHDGATITGYTATLDGRSVQIEYSSEVNTYGYFSEGTPTMAGTLVLSVTANDSLGLSTPVSENVTVIPWQAPTLVATAIRTNNFESETTLAISGTFAPVVVKEEAKNTLTCAYRFKRSLDAEWGEWVDRPITIEDSKYSAVDLILSFDNESQWDIEVKVTDKFTTVTQPLTLSIGKPILFIDQGGQVSINRKPTHHEADLDVEGLIYSKDQPVMTTHVGQIIFTTTLTTADAVRAQYGGTWTAWSGLTASGLYCWRRTA